jgi:nucleotide-binding universal stress UspA family protein
MAPLRTILLAIDPSLPVAPRIRYCAELACVANAEVGLLHVIEPGCSEYWEGVERVQRQIDESPINPFRTWSAVLPGKPVEVIPAFAATVHAGLVIVTARRRRGLSRALLGSTSMTIARRAQCPVLLCSEASAGDESGGFQCRRIVCVIAFNESTSDYIAYIDSFAKHVGARVTFVYALPEIHEGQLASAIYGDDDFVMRPEDARDKLAQLASVLSVPYDVVVASGDAAKLVRQELGAASECIIATNNNRSGCRPLVEDLAGALAAPLLTVPFRYAQSRMGATLRSVTALRV